MHGHGHADTWVHTYGDTWGWGQTDTQTDTWTHGDADPLPILPVRALLLPYPKYFF